jgi:hypothetical protein
MRWMLLALCACNRILGLDDLGVRAPYIDAPLDAQPYCPPFGTPPRFSPVLHEVIDQRCVGYETSATIVVAECTGNTGTEIAAGTDRSTLALIAGLPALLIGHIFRPTHQP